MSSKIDMKSVISTAASLAATAMVIRSFAHDIISRELTRYITTKFQHFLTTFTNEVTLVISEFDGLDKNQLFNAAELYIGTIAAPSAKTLHATLPEKEKKIRMSLGGDESVADRFRGYRLKWRLVTVITQPRKVQQPDEYYSTVTSEVRSLELTFHKRHRSQVIDEYLPYVVERSKDVREDNKMLKLHTLSDDGLRSPWQSVNLVHPANFRTLALDDEVKNMIIDDLDRFVKRKELYRKVGKAWKRGYLLYGPPGTGKSSLIAAMANYLNFDVYDLELTDLRRNSELRRLLIATANRSILVVEDIDASIDLSERNKAGGRPSSAPRRYPYYHDQEQKVTLSGLLNFIDGLWTSCGDERIIIFTTNHREKLDPALLRPGRMDLHIHMSYCTPCGFKLLVANYLGITEHHPLVTEAELLIASTKVTPAEVGEQLLKSDDPEIAINGLILFLKRKKETENDLEENVEATIIGADKLQELLQTGEEPPVDMSGKIIKKGEAAKALKLLIGFLEDEIRTGKTEGSNASSVLESGEENETNIE